MPPGPQPKSTQAPPWQGNARVHPHICPLTVGSLRYLSRCSTAPAGCPSHRLKTTPCTQDKHHIHQTAQPQRLTSSDHTPAALQMKPIPCWLWVPPAPQPESSQASPWQDNAYAHPHICPLTGRSVKSRRSTAPAGCPSHRLKTSPCTQNRHPIHQTAQPQPLSSSDHTPAALQMKPFPDWLWVPPGSQPKSTQAPPWQGNAYAHPHICPLTGRSVRSRCSTAPAGCLSDYLPTITPCTQDRQPTRLTNFPNRSAAVTILLQPFR